jgi:hypothetical protein
VLRKSPSHRDAFGIEGGEVGFEETSLSFFDVIRHATELKAISGGLVDDVTRAGIVVAWLADTLPGRSLLCGVCPPSTMLLPIDTLDGISIIP